MGGMRDAEAEFREQRRRARLRVDEARVRAETSGTANSDIALELLLELHEALTVVARLDRQLAATGCEPFGRVVLWRDDNIHVLRALATHWPDKHCGALAEGLVDVATALLSCDRPLLAIERAREGEVLLRTDPESNKRTLLEAIETRYRALTSLDRFGEALGLQREVLELRRQLVSCDEDREELVMALLEHCSALGELELYEQAVAPAREAVMVQRILTQTGDKEQVSELANTLDQLGLVLVDVGQIDEALSAFREADSILLEDEGNSSDLIRSKRCSMLVELGEQIVNKGRHDQGIALIREGGGHVDDNEPS